MIVNHIIHIPEKELEMMAQLTAEPLPALNLLKNN
jgi:hypothetical protein